jgi:23S rRNA G2445 N2-methylase RlmL
MKQIAIVPKGLEDQAIKEIGGRKVMLGRVLTENVDLTNVQSVMKVYEFFGELVVKNIEDFMNLKFDEKLNGTIKVSCHREGKHDFNSQDVERVIGGILRDEGYEVNYKEYDDVLFVDVVDDKVLFGKELTRKLLSKREYRIKVHKQSINACTAYCMVRLSDWKEGIILDPFSKDGIVPIEAELFRVKEGISGKIVGYDSLFHNVRSAEINSKLAEIKIKLARFDATWLDTKFEDDEVSVVVSSVPFPSKTVSENKMITLYQDLFKALKLILKGKAVFIAPKVELLKQVAEEIGFKIVDERITFMGKAEFKVVVLQK